MATAPNNKEIIKLLKVQQEEKLHRLNLIEERLGAVEAQCKLTNGRVTKLEREQIERLAAQQAVEDYKKSQGGSASVVVNQSANELSPLWKVVFTLMGIIGTTLSVIAVMAAR